MRRYAGRSLDESGDDHELGGEGDEFSLPAVSY